MKIQEFFDKLRDTYLSNFNSQEKETQQRKLNEIDSLVVMLLKKNHKRNFILNNKLSCYFVYLNEKGLLKNEVDEKIKNNVYERFNKCLNTITFLNSLAKEANSKILLIKTFNVIPYLPVYDFDIVVKSNNLIKSISNFSELYKESLEEEENKKNFLSLNPQKYFKLSFHSDITWDGIKKLDMNEENLWKNSISCSSHTYVNSPIVDAQIKFQECLLERLYFNLIDYLFITKYTPSNYSALETRGVSLKSFPHYIGFSELTESKGNPELYKKNFKRWFIWKIYSFITGNIPFREKID